MLMKQPVRFRGKSIRTQLVLSNILALALLLGILGGVIHYAVRTTIIASVDRQLETRSRAMAIGGPHGPPGPHFFDHPHDFFPGGPGGGPPDSRNGIDQFLQWPHQPPPAPMNAAEFRNLNKYRPHLFGLDGQSEDGHEVFNPWNLAAFDAAKRGRLTFTDIRIDNQPYRLLSRPYPVSGAPQGVIQDVYPLADIHRAIRGVDSVLLTLSPVALLCAGFAGYFLTGRVLNRVSRMTQAAARIQDFSERIPVSGNDEFSEMAGTFNGLLGRLELAIKRQIELNEMQRRFTADASHELKTPLTIIKGNTGIALKSEECRGDFRETIEEIDRATATMSQLVRDLLLLAQSDDGLIAVNPQASCVADLVEEAICRVNRQEATPVVVDDIDPDLMVTGNRDSLVRLFANLVQNALQHTPVSGTVTVSAAREDRSIVVKVRDTGVGIAPEHLSHLGERFYRVDSARARNAGGTGLGLAICKEIVQAHHGTIHFDSELGKGTTVTVALPA